MNFKELSPSFAKLAKPSESFGRSSLGFESNVGEFHYINVGDLVPYHNQARQHFSQEEIELLAESIAKHGIRNPLTIIPHGNEKGVFETVGGERRLRAAKFLGMEKVPCIILKDVNLADEIALVENIHRQDLHPVELGNAFKTLLSKGVFTSQSNLAEKLSVPRSAVAEYLQFADFNEDIKKYLIENQIVSRDKLRQLYKVKDQPEVLQKIISNNNHIDVIKKSFSVVRIKKIGNEFHLQTSGIAKLSEDEKSNLKHELQKLILQI